MMMPYAVSRLHVPPTIVQQQIGLRSLATMQWSKGQHQRRLAARPRVGMSFQLRHAASHLLTLRTLSAKRQWMEMQASVLKAAGEPEQPSG